MHKIKCNRHAVKFTFYYGLRQRFRQPEVIPSLEISFSLVAVRFLCSTRKYRLMKFPEIARHPWIRFLSWFKMEKSVPAGPLVSVAAPATYDIPSRPGI